MARLHRWINDVKPSIPAWNSGDGFIRASWRPAHKAWAIIGVRNKVIHRVLELTLQNVRFHHHPQEAYSVIEGTFCRHRPLGSLLPAERLGGFWTALGGNVRLDNVAWAELDAKGNVFVILEAGL